MKLWSCLKTRLSSHNNRNGQKIQSKSSIDLSSLPTSSSDHDVTSAGVKGLSRQSVPSASTTSLSSPSSPSSRHPFHHPHRPNMEDNGQNGQGLQQRLPHVVDSRHDLHRHHLDAKKVNNDDDEDEDDDDDDGDNINTMKDPLDIISPTPNTKTTFHKKRKAPPPPSTGRTVGESRTPTTSMSSRPPRSDNHNQISSSNNKRRIDDYDDQPSSSSSSTSGVSSGFSGGRVGSPEITTTMSDTNIIRRRPIITSYQGDSSQLLVLSKTDHPSHPHPHQTSFPDEDVDDGDYRNHHQIPSKSVGCPSVKSDARIPELPLFKVSSSVHDLKKTSTSVSVTSGQGENPLMSLPVKVTLPRVSTKATTKRKAPAPPPPPPAVPPPTTPEVTRPAVVGPDGRRLRDLPSIVPSDDRENDHRVNLSTVSQSVESPQDKSLVVEEEEKIESMNPRRKVGQVDDDDDYDGHSGRRREEEEDEDEVFVVKTRNESIRGKDQDENIQFKSVDDLKVVDDGKDGQGVPEEERPKMESPSVLADMNDLHPSPSGDIFKACLATVVDTSTTCSSTSDLSNLGHEEEEDYDDRTSITTTPPTVNGIILKVNSTRHPPIPPKPKLVLSTSGSSTSSAYSSSSGSPINGQSKASTLTKADRRSPSSGSTSPVKGQPPIRLSPKPRRHLPNFTICSYVDSRSPKSGGTNRDGPTSLIDFSSSKKLNDEKIPLTTSSPSRKVSDSDGLVVTPKSSSIRSQSFKSSPGPVGGLEPHSHHQNHHPSSMFEENRQKVDQVLRSTILNPLNLKIVDRPSTPRNDRPNRPRRHVSLLHINSSSAPFFLFGQNDLKEPPKDTHKSSLILTNDADSEKKPQVKEIHLRPTSVKVTSVNVSATCQRRRQQDFTIAPPPPPPLSMQPMSLPYISDSPIPPPPVMPPPPVPVGVSKNVPSSPIVSSANIRDRLMEEIRGFRKQPKLK